MLRTEEASDRLRIAEASGILRKENEIDVLYLANGASGSLTYLIGAAASLVLYFVLGSDGNLLKEYGKLNWAPFVLGIVIVGLEAGWIYAYKAGWQVSTGFIVQSAFLAMSLLLVGYFIFREALTWNKVVGVAICLVGLIFINLK